MIAKGHYCVWSCQLAEFQLQLRCPKLKDDDLVSSIRLLVYDHLLWISTLHNLGAHRKYLYLHHGPLMVEIKACLVNLLQAHVFTMGFQQDFGRTMNALLGGLSQFH